MIKEQLSLELVQICLVLTISLSQLLFSIWSYLNY